MNPQHKLIEHERPPRSGCNRADGAGPTDFSLGAAPATLLTEQRRPELRMAMAVSRRIMLTVGANPPETGGILLGPIGSNDITDFYYDDRASCSVVTFSPDHVTLGKKLREEWIPAGIDMKGFVHSHPGGSQLSGGDLYYIGKILDKNPDMPLFAAPIILPEEFRICPFVVLRGDPQNPRKANLILM